MATSLTISTFSADPVFDLAPYEESNEEPTLEVTLTKSDAVYEAHEKLRAGNHEAAGVWFLVAGGLGGS